MSELQYRSALENIMPYVPGKPIDDVKKELGLDNIIKLASNENPYGCSPVAKQAIIDELSNPALYPDGNCTLLREKLAKSFNLKPEQFVFGAGSNEIISFIAQVFLNEGDESIFADPSFVWYDIAVKTMNAVPVKVPLKNYTHDLNGMLDKITDKTKVIWLCNPNNPTGTIFTKEEQVDFLEKVPKNIVVVLDEAYYEFVSSKEYPESVALLDKYPNIIILRTFSKIYGLASLRVGYGLASEEVIGYLNRVRPPFNINTFAQHAAMACLDDEDFKVMTHVMNKKQRERLYTEFENLGLKYVESQTNFIWVETPMTSREIFNELLQLGIIIRPFMDNWIRITVGTEQENTLLIDALKEIL